MDANVLHTSQKPRNANGDYSTSSASALPIGEKLKEYLITGVIGEGGFGIVYAARDTLLQRDVAIKEYMPAAIANRHSSFTISLRSPHHQKAFNAGLQGFIDEARLLAQFKHPALVEILRFWEANSTAYMVMPHYSGKTLRNLLRQDTGLRSEARLKSIIAPILDATELLHSHDLYHRDIAPDNIVIKDNGQPVLLDLGSARRVIAGIQSALTVVVKPGYAPIEQYSEDTLNEQGPWTDVYALGAVLFLAITGNTPSASVSRMMRDTLKPLTPVEYPQFSSAFLSAINRALKLRPCDRFRSINEFRNALDLDTTHINSAGFVSPLISNAKPVDNTDDEITQILTEDEINRFKEKLLHTLSAPRSTRTIDSPQKNEPLSQIEKNTDSNIFLDRTLSENKSLSSFEDVKELLERPPHTSKKGFSSKENNSGKNIAANTNINSLHQKRLPLALAGIVGLTVVVIALLIILYLPNSTKEETEFTQQNESTGKKKEPAEVTQSDIYQRKNHIDSTFSFDGEIEAVDRNITESSLTLGGSIDSIQHAIPAPKPEQVLEATTPHKPTDLTVEALKEAHPPTVSSTEKSDETSKATQIVMNIEKKNSLTFNRKESAQDQSETTAATTLEPGVAKLTLLPWGEVWVNNQRYGVSPPVHELSLMPGTYRIELRNPGQQTEIRTIDLKQGKNATIFHNFSTPTNSTKTGTKLNKVSNPELYTRELSHADADQTNQLKSQTNSLPAHTSKMIGAERVLNIKVQPWGEIFIDEKMVGVTPPKRQINLSPGDHIIEIRHPNFPTKRVSIGKEDYMTDTLEHHFK